MKVRFYLSILVLAGTLGAWLTERMIASGYSELERCQHQEQHLMLLRKDFEYFALSAKQLLVTSDLVLAAGETYLADGAQSLVELLKTRISSKLTIATDIIPEANGSLLLSALTGIGGALKAAVVYPKTADPTLLQRYDVHAETLVNVLEEVSALVQTHQAEARARLDGAKTAARSVTTLSTLAFLLLVLVLWVWANRRISDPLKKLATMADSTQDNLEFVGVSKGPHEVMALSNRLVKLTDLLLQQAKHDPLTELFNRREFERQLSQVLCQRRETDQSVPSCLCYIDLDHFKVINDTCGHAAGDELLKQVAEALLAGVRKTDVVARLGGDEFCLLLKNCNAAQARRVTEDIRHDIEQIHYVWGSSSLEISASIGVCEISKSAMDMQDVMQSVDIACSAAKRSGRNRVHIVDGDHQMVMRKRQDMALVNLVTSGLRAGRVHIHLQEVVPLKEELGTGKRYEALARMYESDGTVIMPGQFLPVVERYGLAARLDSLVLEKVVKGFSENAAAMEQLAVVGVNVSGQTMGDETFGAGVHKLLADLNFPGGKLCLEITETAAVGDQEKARDFANDIKRSGVIFALDDFGSGHASFNYLKNFPVDVIKIDGQFVVGMLSDEMDMTTVKSIIELARVGGRRTVAEFVENPEVVQVLTELGVDFGQGYHFGRPVPMDDILRQAEETFAATG